ncbi:MAG: thiamine phosphate synthase [Coxiella endosymbiont of Haemaphysalis qinghaiensis]
MKKPIVWVICGSDCSGGAGCQADLLTCRDFNVHAATVITAITAQNAQEVLEIHYCDSHLIQMQINSLEKAFAPSVVKLGLLGKKSTLITINSYLQNYKGFIVCDPVLKSTSGASFTKPFDLKRLIFPYINLLTINIPEAEIFLQQKIHSLEDMAMAAPVFLELGVKSVLLKGGHLSSEKACDFFTDGDKKFWLINSKIKETRTRGTGCSLSSAISSAFSRGYSLEDSLILGKMYIQQGIRENFKIKNNILLGRLGFPRYSLDLPVVTKQVNFSSFPFLSCGKLGFYPIVDSVEWVRKLLTCGVRTIQLRIKNKKLSFIKQAIIESVCLARNYQAKLFINDYWKLAIETGAYGVHLGQEDLTTADIFSIHTANLRLGISTHSLYELACAHAFRPSYIAFGPIYETTSKEMPFPPQGLAALRYWQKISPYPIVAIGGITLECLEAVLRTKVRSVAVISAVMKADEPAKVLSAFLSRMAYFSRESDQCANFSN